MSEKDQLIRTGQKINFNSPAGQYNLLFIHFLSNFSNFMSVKAQVPVAISSLTSPF